MKIAAMGKFSKRALVLTLVLSFLFNLTIAGVLVRADNGYTNIALGKLAEFRNDNGSLIEAAWGNVAGNAIDGNGGTVAQGAFDGPYNLVVDLNGVSLVGSVTISWDGTNYATDYDIKVSSDGTNWTTVATETGNGGGTAVETIFTEVECKKIMIDATDVMGGGPYGADGFGYGIWEMQIMGKSVETLTNLALNKTATMLKDDGTVEADAWGQIAANAVDGNAGTVAQGADVGVPWNLKVDLGGYSRISKIVIDNFWTNEIRKFDVKVSTDGTTWSTILTNAVPAWNTQTIFDLSSPADCKYVLLDVTEFMPNTQGVIGDFAVMGISIAEPETNIALNKPAFMKKDDGTAEADAWGNVAANAVDGNAGTVAQGADVNEPWNLIVNLKAASTSISKVAITNFWAADIKTCNVKASNDGVNWTTVLSNLTPTYNSKTTYNLETTLNCKFIMLDVTSFAADSQGTVAEFEIIGTIVDEVATNIALNKPAYMLKDDGTVKNFGYDNAAYKAVDGDNATWAQGSEVEPVEPWNLVVNLKAISTNITQIAIHNIWASTITNCNIKASTDGVNWTTVLTGLTPSWNTTTLYDLPSPLNTRFIMLDVVSFEDGSTGGIIAEFKAIGTMIADTDSVAPEVTGIANNSTNGKKAAVFSEGFATLNGNPYTSGTEISATGNYQLIVKDLNDNATTVDFTIIIYGDVSGDGNIDVTDLAAIKNHLLKSYLLTDAYLTAGDIFGKGNISISDLIAVKKHILNIQAITQMN